MNRKLKMFFMFNKIKIIVLSAIFILIIIAIIGMASLESFYRNITLAQLPVQIFMGGIQAAIFVTILILFQRGGMTRIQQSKIKGEKVNVHWDDVIGIDEVKEEAREVVELIKDRTKITKIGGKILRGLLLLGPPGCGKTMLAKAIATEAGIPFLSMAASEFVEIFVGVGSSKVRKLFKKARIFAYGYGACIIFIDELDAIGRARSFSFGGGQETNNTLNQLLVEMDGLKEDDLSIIVIGATNAQESIIDEALLRPGRFDRKLYIGKPGLEGRQQIFEYYLSKIKYDPKIDIPRLARKTVYKSPADIENIVKEAALIATREKKEIVEHKEISAAIERIDMGMKQKRKMTVEERKKLAYHEAGHLLVLCVLHPTDDVFKASIVSRKDTLGAVYHQPREEIFNSDKNRLLANIQASLGGYVSEKLVFGVTSDGVLSDFQNAMRYAHSMVWQLGMSESRHLGDYTIIPESQISESLKNDLNKETEKIFGICYDEVEKLLNKDRVLLDTFAEALLEKEELEYDEIEEIFQAYKKNQEPEVRSQKSEVRSQKSGARSQEPEVRSQKSEVGTKTIYKVKILLLFLIFLPSCFEPTYKDDEIVESVKNIVSKEFEIKDIKVERVKNVLWIYIPVEQIIDENELDKETLEKIGKVSRAGSRVIFSSDRKVKFIVIVAYDKIGIELKMVRHIEDVKKVQAWYIAYSDFYKRMDIGLGFNPEVMGRKSIKDMYLNKEDISKFFLSKINKNKINSISKSGNISELHSLRINENQALIYVKTMDPNFKSLFLVDVEAFDILKELLMLFLTTEKEKLNLPLIADFWNLSKEDWPWEYKDYQNAGDWEGRVYAKEINFNKFIARQIKRRIEKRFEEKYDEWNVKFKELNVTFLRDEILVSREIYPLNKPVYDIEIDHEISIIIANTINNYQLNEVKSLVIGDPGWGERTVTSRTELLKLKPKKWKSIEKVKKDKEMSIKDVLLWMFLPQYDTQWNDIVQPADSDEPH